MFGDFSSFSHDPELGVSGVYLSQGSPLLDSDWNEQVAALTEWLTVLGRTVKPEIAPLFGFDLAVVTQTDEEKARKQATLYVNPGMGLVHGRPVQSQSRHQAIVGEGKEGDQTVFPTLSGSKFFTSKSKGVSSWPVSLSVVSRVVPSDIFNHRRSFAVPTRGARELTDWMIHVGDAPKPNRSFGDGNGLTPRMWVRFGSETILPDGVWLIECHSAKDGGKFKIAFSPDNLVALESVPGIVSGTRITLSRSLARFFDSGSSNRVLFEYEDDLTVHQKSVELLFLDDDEAALPFEGTVELSSQAIALTPNADRSIESSRRPVLRFWHALVPAVALDKLPLAVSTPAHGIALTPKVEGKVVLKPGDRWYLPIVNGRPAGESPDHPAEIPGHRVFRAVTKLGDLTLAQDGTITAASTKPDPLLTARDRDSERIVTGRGVVDAPQAPAPEADETAFAARPFSDSMHRLTSALNATRVLTRNTPCKELQTRVSCLPLRRWLASAYVHELADLDLDAFVSKVQRSIDIVPEDEYRFREQAALVLEEARALAGCVEPAPVQWA